MGPCRPQAKANVDMDWGVGHTQRGMDKVTRGHRPHLTILLALRSSSFSPLLSPLPRQRVRRFILQLCLLPSFGVG